VVFLILLFFLLFPHSVLATSNIQITDYSVKTPEWIQITNNSSESSDISGWYFKYASGNTKVLDGCISPNSTKVYEYSGFLNGTGESLSLYDRTNNLVQDLGVINITQKDKPSSSSTCVIPTNTPIPTTVPTFTPTPTNTPTPDPTVVNPNSGISLTEFMPYSSLEWAEIYNDNNYPVKLVGWKLNDNNLNTKNFDLSIGSKSYATFDFSSFLNNDGDKIILINNLGQTVSHWEYSGNNYTLDYSWSLVSGSWCRAAITKGNSNAGSCYLATTPTVTSSPTSTITPTASPTDRNLYTADESATASAIIDPVSESTTLPISPTIAPTPTISGLVLGNNDSPSTTKNKYLPLIFILVGGCLLASPLILNKIKKK